TLKGAAQGARWLCLRALLLPAVDVDDRCPDPRRARLVWRRRPGSIEAGLMPRPLLSHWLNLRQPAGGGGGGVTSVTGGVGILATPNPIVANCQVDFSLTPPTTAPRRVRG